jgi:hypothetical protein
MRDQAKSKDARETPQRLIESAKRRLQLWNVTSEQVAELEKTRKASDTLTLLSPPTSGRSLYSPRGRLYRKNPDRRRLPRRRAARRETTPFASKLMLQTWDAYEQSLL